MQTSGLYILKTLCIFGLLAGIGIMEAISAAASDSVEQEVCERVGLLVGLCVPARSQGSNRPCARTEAPVGLRLVPVNVWGMMVVISHMGFGVACPHHLTVEGF